MYCAMFIIDSWHLNGVHCPNYRTTKVCETLEEAVERLFKQIFAYKLRDDKGNDITAEYCINDFKNSKYNSSSIYFTYPREGYIIIEGE